MCQSAFSWLLAWSLEHVSVSGGEKENEKKGFLDREYIYKAFLSIWSQPSSVVCVKLAVSTQLSAIQRSYSTSEGLCRNRAAAPHQTSKLSPNRALVSLPLLLHTLLNMSVKNQMPRGQVFTLPASVLITLVFKGNSPLLLRRICEKHDAVKLMLKEWVGARKWGKRVKESGGGGVYIDMSLRSATEEGSSFGLEPLAIPSLSLTMHIKCMTRSEEGEF